MSYRRVAVCCKHSVGWYVVYDTSEANPVVHGELRRLYYSGLDHISGEMEARLKESNSKLDAALSALDPESATFWDLKSL